MKKETFETVPAWIVLILEDNGADVHRPVGGRFVLCLSEREALNVAAEHSRDDGVNTAIMQARHMTIAWKE